MTLLADGTHEKAAVTLRCKCWDCEGCRPGRLKRLYAEVCGGEPTAMITLTTQVREGVATYDEARSQSEWMHELMRRIKKHKSMKDLAYHVTREATKVLWPHMHIMWRGPWIDQAWLQEQWQDITKHSYRVDIRKIDPGRAGNYLRSYVKKAPARFATARRTWKTKAYDKREKHEGKPKKDYGAPWQRVRQCVISFAEKWYELGMELTWTSYDRVEARAPP